jgi:carbonic anhydrase
MPVPIGLIFNEGPNDLFVVRVAGNGTGSDVLGSLKYAIEHLGGSLKLIVVLGHSGCGAVTTAVDVFLNPAGYPRSSPSTRCAAFSMLCSSRSTPRRRSSEAMGPEVARRPGYRKR